MKVIASIVALSGAVHLRSTATQKQKESHHVCYQSCHTKLVKWFETGRRVIKSAGGTKEPIKEKSMANHICRMICWKVVHKPTWRELTKKRTDAFAQCFNYKNAQLCEEQTDDEGLCRWSVDETIDGVQVRGLNFCVPAIKSNAEAFCVAANHPLHRKWERKCRGHNSENATTGHVPTQCQYTGDSADDNLWPSGCSSMVPGCATGKADRAIDGCNNTQVHFHLYNTVLMCHYTMRHQRRTHYICNKMQNKGEWDGVWNIKFPNPAR